MTTSSPLNNTLIKSVYLYLLLPLELLIGYINNTTKNVAKYLYSIRLAPGRFGLVFYLYLRGTTKKYEEIFKNIDDNSLYRLILNFKKGFKKFTDRGPKYPKDSKNTQNNNLLSTIRKKKHRSVDHCHDFLNQHSTFQKKWWNVSGIYKITYLNCRHFYYYGSSRNLGQRLKYYYYNGPSQISLLGIFLKRFGWKTFSVTIVEVCSPSKIQERENWYLKKYRPLLNILEEAYSDSRSLEKSPLTKLKISTTLLGRSHNDDTRLRMSNSRLGAKNQYWQKGLPKATLDAAAAVLGKPIYVYTEESFTLVNDKPFRSIREAVKHLPISQSTLPRKLDSSKPFKGYYYFSKPQSSKP